MKKVKQLKIPAFIEEPVDNPNAVYIGTLEYECNGMIMSHMGSPNLEVLHELAQKLGIRRWFQDDEHHLHPHYDVCKSKKKEAIKLGAIEVDDRDLIKFCYPRLKDYMNGGELKLNL